MKKAAVVAALSAMLSLAACAADSPKQRDAAELARFERYASPPQDHMHYFQLQNFQYLGKNAQNADVIAVWTGVNQVYLLTLEQPCINLDFAFAIGLTSTAGSVNARMDRVKYDHGRECRIMQIQKVDYKAMRAAQQAGKAQPPGT
ncbi:MAG: hypothetical protein C4338_04035 [Rhodanobacteraceae bacterium]